MAWLAIVVCSMFTLSACQQAPNYDYIEGQTMGTSYHIRYQQPKDIDKQSVQQAVNARLVEINHSMSTYQKDSLISQFNRLPAHQVFQIDNDFLQVFNSAKTVYNQSGGAFNPTVLPLIELWGFGSTMTVDRLQSPPTEQEIATAKHLIDFDAITANEMQLSKSKDNVALDFSAIAKGYGVDAIAQLLQEKYQIQNYMVEIGGEVATAGVNAKSQPWQIAIDAPILNSSVSERQTIAAIRQPKEPNRLNLATSGNYRNSVVFDGQRYSHTIDPITGMPIVGGAPSVTVSADSVTLADAWATALTAMPYEKALDIATQKDLAVMFIVPKKGQEHTQDNQSINAWEVVETPAMQALRSGKTATN
ncbi:FAD:protein FMN transferase [Psychrobacter sp. I-STPA6b]|uniref:FAD:protein FMN transferase n=1 Tax=Psychrobacter sp. I-STPA6b TaxID=2585718 RepID=UPI0039B3F5A3